MRSLLAFALLATTLGVSPDLSLAAPPVAPAPPYVEPLPPPGPPILGERFIAPRIKTWVEAEPLSADLAGKVVLHWFCAKKPASCRDDLARIATLYEAGKVYVVAYITGSKRDALKLDPTQGEVAAGAITYGKSTTVARKLLKITAQPTTVVVGTDGRVNHIAVGDSPDVLDARDKAVRDLVGKIREMDVNLTAPSEVRVGAPFEVQLRFEVAAWLDPVLIASRTIGSGNPASDRGTPGWKIALAVPPDVTCDKTVITSEALAVSGRILVAKATCTAKVKGAYELGLTYDAMYEGPNRTRGVARDALRAKFVAKP